VLSLLQDGDPALATAISSSREALWGILADPVKVSPNCDLRLEHRRHHVRRIFILVLAVSAVFGGGRMLSAEEPSMVTDLAATIALQGMPCDKVVDAKRNGDSDYTASCKDGNRYHVFVDSTGRVVVKKL